MILLEERVIFADMPAVVKAYTICSDGFYTIVLNSTLSREQNLISYQHEIMHIKNGDFDKKCSADLIELYSHRR